LGEPAQKKEVQNMNRQGKEEKEKLRQKKKLSTPQADEIPANSVGKRNVFVVPQPGEVQQYFASQKFPAVEAAKFYNYFQSNGWLVGGRTKMKDWQAAALNWMLNTNKFAQLPLQKERAGVRSVKPKAKHLHATTNKNYSEPL
jgi:hypothetical protein